MADTFRYKAFISYSHADERWGTWLHRALERYRVPSYLATKHRLPKAPLRPVFRDREELATSSSLSESIETALAASENLILVCSPAAAQSKWVNEEIEAFGRLGRGDRIFCLIVDGSDDDCFPEALAGREPLAADVREGADSRQDAKLRLISGLLNIQFGELKNREQKRRNRVLGASLGASLVVAGIMTVLAAFAVAASNESERQRLIAEKALADATAATEFLSNLIEDVEAKNVGYTIADNLRDQSALWGEESVKPGDIVRNFNNFAAARAVLVGHVLEPALVKASDALVDQPLAEARVLETIARGYDSIVNCEKAIEVQNSAVELLTQELGKSAEGTLKSRLLLADYYECSGERETAHEITLDVLRMARTVYGDSHLLTMRAMYHAGQSYLYRTGGFVWEGGLMRPGPVRVKCDDGMEGACDLYAEGTALLEQSVDAYTRHFGRDDPQTLQAMIDLAWGLFVMGEHDDAIAMVQGVLSIERDSQDVETAGHIRRSRIEDALYALAAFHQIMRKFDDSHRYLREQLSVSQERLGAGHPANLDIYLNLADTYILEGKPGGAESTLREMSAIVKTTQSDEVIGAVDELRTLVAEGDRACDYNELECKQAFRGVLMKIWGFLE